MRMLLFCFLILLSMMNTSQAQQDTLYYVGDPMCSWCYGFAPEISTLKERLPEDIAFQLVLGGLRPNGTQTMEELSDFLRHHWEEIATLTGQPFRYDILQQGDFIYNTEPACRAVVVARQLAPDHELDFFKAIQAAFYAQNKNPHDVETYLEIARHFEIDVHQFRRLFESKEFQQLTNMDFQIAASMGVRGFPSLVLKKGEQLYLVSNGYQKASALLEKIAEFE